MASIHEFPTTPRSPLVTHICKIQVHAGYGIVGLTLPFADGFGFNAASLSPDQALTLAEQLQLAAILCRGADRPA